jgi:hypothetical protein
MRHILLPVQLAARKVALCVKVLQGSMVHIYCYRDAEKVRPLFL